MIPASSTTGATYDPDLRDQRSVNDAAPVLDENKGPSISDHGASGEPSGLPRTDGFQARKIKRRDYSTPQLQTKRQNLEARKSPSGQEAPALHRKRARRLRTVSEEINATGPCHLLPATQPIQGRSAQGTQYNVPSGDEEARNRMVNDVDSVQGGLEDALAATESTTQATSATGVRPSMVVPIKIASSPQDLELLRQRLASKILDVLLTGLQHRNLALLSDMVNMLKTIWKDDRSRLLDIYGTELNDHRGHLVRWSQCIEALVTFCELTGFSGNETTRAEFLNGVFEEVPPGAARAFIHARSSIAQWRCESDFSDDAFARAVASILFHSASWAGMMRLSQMEDLTLKFSQELFAWFS